MDFFRVVSEVKNSCIIFKPSFIVDNLEDLIVRGRSFYAVWDDKKEMWSTDEMDLRRIVDDEIKHAVDNCINQDSVGIPKYLRDYNSKSWSDYNNYIKSMPDSRIVLDNKLTFANTSVKKKDYISKRLPYNLEEGLFEAWDELVGTLYDPSEREKIEWSIGSIVSGDSKTIQKFLVLYGEAGSGKSTILNIIQMLFQGYYTTFEAKALTSSNNTFSTDAFRSNPLVAIQHDGDLSRIEDNSKLNSIISHEDMQINEKYKPSYTARINCFLYMATNRPVKITDSKSGIIRRLIDVKPSGRRIPTRRYNQLMKQVEFELGAIAWHCLQVYKELGKTYYNGYTPQLMMYETDPFFNFVEDNYLIFKNEDGVTLKQAWTMYKEYRDNASLNYGMPMYKFREELKDYFREFYPNIRLNGEVYTSYYKGFITSKFMDGEKNNEVIEDIWLKLDKIESIFDKECASYPAQYATSNDTPQNKWEDVKTVLADLNTSGKVHYVKVPENHIVIDFDLKDTDGNKSKEKNLEAASKWPKTYAEYSKGGNGIHLHYIYDGDVSKLSRIYDENIEIKVFIGNSSLRRKLTFCNDLPIAHISSGLPLKEVSSVVDFDTILNEKAIRTLIEKNIRKEYHSSTAQSVDFIYHILEEQYEKGAKYDVTDLRPKVMAFANNSTNQADKCLRLVVKMKFRSKDETWEGNDKPSDDICDDDELIFFDVEVFPNLFLVNYKVAGEGKNVVRMINPTPSDIEPLLSKKLVGFNCRRYDNHVLYARYIGYTNEELFQLSQRIVSNDKHDDEQRNCLFREAYNLSYTDVYDFSSAANKKSLKQWEIDLGIHHKELGLPWDQPVPKEIWPKVAEYCDNDVISTEIVFNHLNGDWAARQILSQMSGLTVNDTTNQHSTKIIFGSNRKPQSEFIYWDLSKPVKEIDDDVRKYLENNTPLPLKFTPYNHGEESILPYFPGYEFKNGISTYRGDIASEGGYVYSEPGIHYNVALLDVASLHPSSAEDMCIFGPEYTQKLSDIKSSRIAFKHENYDDLENMLGGILVQFAEMAKKGIFSPKDISNALKTVINSIYGLTSAKFQNAFKDPRNIDNIVAKRGALFMIDLKNAVQEKGYSVAHIKTDSIKIPNATKEIVQFVMEFGKKYGYIFEHEATYEKMCLIDKANYVAKYSSKESCQLIYGYVPGDNDKKYGQWTVTGDAFAHPYIFKTLFSHEPIVFKDYGESKSVTTALYLDMNEDLEDVSQLENEYKKLEKKYGSNYPDLIQLGLDIEKGHNYQFVGKVGNFIPVNQGSNGGILVRKKKDGGYDSASGAKGYRWLEAETVKELGIESEINMSYFRTLVDEALAQIAKFGDVEAFIANDPVELYPDNILPWCNKEDCNSCNIMHVCHDEALDYVSQNGGKDDKI